MCIALLWLLINISNSLTSKLYEFQVLLNGRLRPPLKTRIGMRNWVKNYLSFIVVSVYPGSLPITYSPLIKVSNHVHGNV